MLYVYDKKKRTTVVKESQTKNREKKFVLRLSNVDQHTSTFIHIYIFICKHLITHQHFTYINICV